MPKQRLDFVGFKQVEEGLSRWPVADRELEVVQVEESAGGECNDSIDSLAESRVTQSSRDDLRNASRVGHDSHFGAGVVFSLVDDKLCKARNVLPAQVFEGPIPKLGIIRLMVQAGVPERLFGSARCCDPDVESLFE
mgnify:CR=1 FL=1